MRRRRHFVPPRVRFFVRKNEILNAFHRSSNFGEYTSRGPSDRRIYINLRSAWSYVCRRKDAKSINDMTKAICITIVHESLHAAMQGLTKKCEEIGELDPTFNEGVIEALAAASLGYGVYVPGPKSIANNGIFKSARKLGIHWRNTYYKDGRMK